MTECSIDLQDYGREQNLIHFLLYYRADNGLSIYIIKVVL